MQTQCDALMPVARGTYDVCCRLGYIAPGEWLLNTCTVQYPICEEVRGASEMELQYNSDIGILLRARNKKPKPSALTLALSTVAGIAVL